MHKWNAMPNMNKSWAWTYFKPWHIFFLWERHERWSFLKRYTKDSDNYLKPYVSNQESNHVIYLDVNNLYGYVMSKFLPTSGFKRRDPEDLDWNKYSSNGTRRYFLILIILKCYVNYIMIILWLQIKQKSKKKCCY